MGFVISKISSKNRSTPFIEHVYMTNVYHYTWTICLPEFLLNLLFLTRFRLALLNFQFVLKPKDLEYLESPLATNPKIHRAKKVNKKPERYFQNHPIWDSNEDPCRVKQTRTENRLTINVAFILREINVYKVFHLFWIY